MKHKRFNDISKISKEIIQYLDDEDYVVIIQFSKPIKGFRLISKINKLCLKYDSKLCVRFYSFIQYNFNCTILKQLSNVKNLSIDCIDNVSNFEVLKELNLLECLNIGIYSLDQKDFLSWDNLKNLKKLVISSINKKNLNLKYLEKYKKLNTLLLNGQSKNISSIGECKELNKISLSISSKVSLDFINELTKLNKLTLILGGRSNIDEIDNNNIEELEILRVRGFNSFNNVCKFKKLKKLTIEDQIKLEEINFNRELTELKELKIINCKNLKTLDGLVNLNNLNHLRIYDTKIDFDTFIQQKLPSKIEILAFYTNKKKSDIQILKKLSSMGYKEFSK